MVVIIIDYLFLGEVREKLERRRMQAVVCVGYLVVDDMRRLCLFVDLVVVSAIDKGVIPTIESGRGEALIAIAAT